MFGSTVAVPLFLAESLCIKNDLVALGEVIGTIFFVCGIATLLQATFGCRLVIFLEKYIAYLKSYDLQSLGKGISFDEQKRPETFS